MLIEFKVSNFLSIYDMQIFSMVASTGKELQNNICSADFAPHLNLVRSAVIYGPNAGGKSNLILALHFIRKLILTSAKESQQGELIPVTSFIFDKKTHRQPSQFEIIFSKEGVRYQYGFVVDEKRIFEEWLYAYPAGRVQQWFNRKYDKNTKKYHWEFSRLFKGGKQQHQLWESATRDNALFFSTAVHLNNEQLKPLFDWFQNDLVVIPSSSKINDIQSIELAKTPIGKQKIIKFMNSADLSIGDIILKTETFSADKLDKKMPEALKELIKENLTGKEMTKINFAHTANKGISLPLHAESDGTQKLWELSGLWINALEKGKVLLIDELDSSLHPLLVQFLLGLISNAEKNKGNTQLIFSTHNTLFLDNELFRRDQIWFVEKDKKNSTQLYPLLHFSPRKQESIERGYLQGRYGALPYIGDWKF